MDTFQEHTRMLQWSPLLWFLGWSIIAGATTACLVGVLINRGSTRTKMKCLICMDDHETLSIPACGHTYCSECLSEYVKGRLKESRYPIHCPTCVTENRPDIHLTQEIFERLDMSEDDKDRLEEARLRLYAVSLSCVRCMQTMWVDREEYLAEDVITCPLPTCRHRWCKFCRKGVPCNTKHRCRNWRLAGLTWRKGWKTCPGCGVLVERTSGCDHITCGAPGCSVHFCYRCGGLIIDASKGGNVGRAVSDHNSQCTALGGCIVQ